jgi:YaaC-like Protein
MMVGAGLGDGSSKPIRPERESGSEGVWRFRALAGSSPDLVADLQRRYPALAESGPKIVIDDDPENRGWVNGGIFVTLGGRSLEEVAETYLADSSVYARPAVGGGAPPSILMTWWVVLFALSQLARYEPATWTEVIAPDRSALTVPIEAALRQAERPLPRLILHALTGNWRG